MSVNKVFLVGRLGRDPETRYTGGGQAVCNFSMATDESFKDKSGERQKRTEWHKIVAWGEVGRSLPAIPKERLARFHRRQNPNPRMAGQGRSEAHSV